MKTVERNRIETARRLQLEKQIATRLGEAARASGAMDESAAWKTYNEELRAAGVDTARGSFDFNWGKFKATYMRAFKGIVDTPKGRSEREKMADERYDFIQKNKDQDSDESADG
jgi:hypothetical protein